MSATLARRSSVRRSPVHRYRSPARRSGTAVVASAAVLLAAGCRPSPGSVCTLIDSESGVTATWRPADFPAGSRFRFCADARCREREAPVPGDGTSAFLQVRLPEEDGPREVAVRFTVTDPADGGRVVHDRSARVALRAVTPNGEKCGPTAWQAGVRADPREGLVVRG
ncbi:hypothetical protein ACFQ8C_25885 [Streptomyces sp. NPDC056503]|uniref:hypothetical protein n=1 Tax=Streptomyces sp. NPDC056503 TaxID=3345842 RepID=UPI00369E613B